MICVWTDTIVHVINSSEVRAPYNRGVEIILVAPETGMTGAPSAKFESKKDRE
jgi:hypothetical protein